MNWLIRRLIRKEVGHLVAEVNIAHENTKQAILEVGKAKKAILKLKQELEAAYPKLKQELEAAHEKYKVLKNQYDQLQKSYNNLAKSNSFYSKEKRKQR